jgi:hypothetical protein
MMWDTQCFAQCFALISRNTWVSRLGVCCSQPTQRSCIIGLAALRQRCMAGKPGTPKIPKFPTRPCGKARRESPRKARDTQDSEVSYTPVRGLLTDA